MQSRFLAYMVIFSIATACAPKHQGPSSPAPAPVPAPAPLEQAQSAHPDCPTEDDTSLDPSRVVQRQTINLKLQYQMVVHKDCNGQEIRRGIEKVTLPSQEFVLKPAGNSWGQWWSRVGGTSYSTAYNRTSCTYSGSGDTLTKILLLPFFMPQMAADAARDAAGYPRVRFNINTSPTALDMRVLKNRDNFIDYEFISCADGSREASACKNPQSLEKGTLILTVNYSEANLPGVAEVKDCDQPDKK